MAFNRALKHAIVDSGKRQIQLAKEAEIDHTKFSQILNGHREATDKEKRAIARVLRCKVGDIFPVALSA